MQRFLPPGPLGFGTAPLGNLFARITEAEAAACTRAALACGIAYIDTAPFYGFGLSEHRVGEALRGVARDQVVISTKVGRLLEPDPHPREEAFAFVGGLPFRPVFDYSAAGVRRSIADSLQRMGLNRIDIVLIHDLAEDTHGPAWRDLFDRHFAEAAAVLTALRAEGMIRAWGLGVNSVEPCLLALEQADPDVFLVAGRYTLLDHTALDTLFPACAARGVGVVIGGPYNSGILAGGTTFNYAPAPAALLERTADLRRVCLAHGVDLRAAALQFCAAHPVVCSVIPGGRTEADVRENAALMAAPIPAALWDALRSEGLLPGHAPCP
jgi:D-threo-aldose 1-dehydrogenase